MAKKKSSKQVSQQKRKARRLLSLARIMKYGASSFARNSWLSVAATAVMTITLLIIFITLVSNSVLTDTISELRYKVDLSIYLKTETTNEQGAEVLKQVKELSSVVSASYISADEARQIAAEKNKSDPEYIAAIQESSNKMPASLRVVVEDATETTELESFIERENIKDLIHPDYKTSFQGDRKVVIETIGQAVNFAQQLGFIAGSIFVIISSLIIFNTIRMAIFNRKEEIQMMKLIGANKSFIRGPFVIESIIYGVIAALIASGVGIWGLNSVSETLINYQILAGPTVNYVTSYATLVVFGMVGIGVIIGIVSSLLATHKYLRI